MDKVGKMIAKRFRLGGFHPRAEILQRFGNQQHGAYQDQ
jgi:hypothetical protein